MAAAGPGGNEARMDGALRGSSTLWLGRLYQRTLAMGLAGMVLSAGSSDAAESIADHLAKPSLNVVITVKVLG